MGRTVAVVVLLLLGLLWLGADVLCSGCSERVDLHTERRGVIYSPSWPSNYPAGVNCSWHIQGGQGEVITLSFQYFDLADSNGCKGDWLLLTSTWNLESRLCGSVLPPPFISTRGRVWLYFHSLTNSSGQAQGFRLSYIRGRLGQSSCQSDEFLCGNGKCLPRSWKCNGQDECGDATDEHSCSPPPTEALPGLCPLGYLTCTQAHSTRCLPASLLCNGARDCPDGSDELGCPGNTCGKHLGNFYGSFASPDFFRPARSAAAELRCTWSLDTQDPKPIVLQVDLQLGPGDSLHVYDGLVQRAEHLLQVLSHHNNKRPAMLESSRGQMSVLYLAQPRSTGHGFNATYQVKGYCFPGERPCGDDQGCFFEHQRCDGYWHCPTGRDEEGCPVCKAGEFPCDLDTLACYPASERCNNQKQCPNGSDEKNCYECQPGNFHCGTNLCIFETWQCDGQEDCLDGSDERDCLAAMPRKVITAALIGSLVCSLLLVIALGCALKLHSLRSREYRAFETQMTRMEAEFVQREAPPSYSQLIAQGLIPPVDDFPAYNATQASVLQNLRLAMHRQIRRHSTRRGNPLSSHRHLWSRVFHNGRRMLLDPAGSTQVTLGLHSVGAQRHQSSPCSGGGPVDESDAGALPVCLGTMDLQPHSPESSAPLPSSGSEIELSPIRRVYGQALQSEPQSPLQRAPTALNGPSPTSQEAHLPMCRTRTSRKLALELAVNLKGVSLKHYSSLGSLSPLSPQPQTSTSSCHSQGQEVTSSPEPTSSVKEEDNNHHVAVEMPCRETRGRDEKRRKRRSKSRLCRFNRTLNDEGGDSEREITPC
ncbi:low-density lipoprotein receptor-related protein 3 [Takifugu flavidus]|uniref:Low-density lipoprotein receptor-related protein 3 n=1 Tax=Takifugu flavidus TaxID=433684 RepID=A0A5C6NNC2_9TELE|nr:low-density lipoprotein receptor-related protein 3 [Takifugu flavidus]TWW67157.1 Low-density lipoprotein receptor-related protein 3 [Takifugu flavidus]